MAAKAKPPKPAKDKSSKSPVAKSTVAKSTATKTTVAKTAASKAIKAPVASKVKAVKAPARAKTKAPAGAAEHVEVAQHVESPPADLEVYYVTLDPLPAQIHRGKPTTAAQTVEYSSFADAKERLIDHLIELIEEAERRLHVLRRATNRDEYPH